MWKAVVDQSGIGRFKITKQVDGPEDGEGCLDTSNYGTTTDEEVPSEDSISGTFLPCQNH